MRKLIFKTPIHVKKVSDYMARNKSVLGYVYLCLLCDLVEKEYELDENETLSEDENSRYVKYVDFLHGNGFRIPFGIEI